VQQTGQCRSERPEIRVIERTDGALEDVDGSPRRDAQNSAALRCEMYLHSPLIAYFSNSSDKAPPQHDPERLTHGGPLQSEHRCKLRRIRARTLLDPRERAKNSDRHVRQILEFAIKRAHTVDKRSHGEQHLAFGGGPLGCIPVTVRRLRAAALATHQTSPRPSRRSS
jgi:hypothetical protein